MQRKFFSSLFVLFALNLLIKPIWIFYIDRPVQNIVGTTVYGQYFALVNLSIIFNFLLDIGLTSFLNKQLSSGKKLMANIFIQAGSLKLLLGLLYAVILMAIGILTGITNISWLLLLGANQFLFSFFLFFRANITAMQLFSVDAWLSVLDKLLMIVACGFLIYFPGVFGKISIYLFLMIQLVAISFSIILTFLVIFYRQKNILRHRTRFDMNMLKSAIPYGLIVLVMSAHSRLDGFILERIHGHGDNEAGIYAQAYRLLDTANMVGYLAAGFLLPFISKAFYERSTFMNVIIKVRNGLMLFSVASIGFCFLFPHQIEQILYHMNNNYAAWIISLTMASLAGYSLVQVYGTLLTATGNIWLFVKVTIPFLLLNMGLNFIFIPHYGAQACCTIAIFTQTAYGLVIMYIANKRMLYQLHSSF